MAYTMITVAEPSLKSEASETWPKWSRMMMSAAVRELWEEPSKFNLLKGRRRKLPRNFNECRNRGRGRGFELHPRENPNHSLFEDDGTIHCE